MREQRQRLFYPDQCSLFFTAENVAPRWNLARYQIGFHPDIDHLRYLRFPNWMLHLDWQELPSQPQHNRFGERMDIGRLMRPIADSHDTSERDNRVVMFTSHLRQPRGSLFRAADDVLGCSGYGKAFNSDTRRHGGKLELSQKYAYALCPENSIGPGYVTEKIAEAFYAGCIPITWCRPVDLELDFNPHAVVNLYGLDEQGQRAVLTRLRDDADYRASLRSEPLLINRPSLQPIFSFLQSIFHDH